MAVNPQDVIGFGGQTPGVQIGGVTTTIPYLLEQQAVSGGTPLARSGTTTLGVPLAFADALASLELIEATYDGIEILAALPNQAYDSTDTLIDTVDISYRIIGRPGVYTVSVPYAINWNAIAFFQVGLQANTIELIYEGADSLNQTPTVFLTSTPVPPSTSNTYYEWQTIDGVRQLVPVQGEPIARPGSPIYQ